MLVAYCFKDPISEPQRSAAVHRRTQSLRHHFALLPTIHRGPVSVLAEYLAFHQHSWLIPASPGLHIKRFLYISIPTLKGRLDLSAFFFSVSLQLADSSLYSPKTQCLLGFVCLGNPICIVLHGTKSKKKKVFVDFWLRPAQNTSMQSFEPPFFFTRYENNIFKQVFQQQHIAFKKAKISIFFLVFNNQKSYWHLLLQISHI